MVTRGWLEVVVEEPSLLTTMESCVWNWRSRETGRRIPEWKDEAIAAPLSISLVTMTMKSMKYSDCDTIMDGYNPVPPPLPRRVPPVRNIYAEPFATDTSTSSRYRRDCDHEEV